MSRGGPASRNAIDPAVFAEYLDSLATYETGGYPSRTRRTINGHAMTASHIRAVRRWRAGGTYGVTTRAVQGVLRWYGLTTTDFATWAAEHGKVPVLRGRLPQSTPKETR